MNWKLSGSIGVLALAGVLAGCTPTAVTPAATAAAAHMSVPEAAPTKSAEPVKMTTPPPLVQGCTVVAISSPARYACNGKVYSSWQLLKIRTDYAKNGRWTAP